VSNAAHTWGGRAVAFKDFTVKDLDAVRTAFGVDNARGMWTVLSLSAFYSDDGERVFTDADVVQASPARMARVLTDMALEAMKVNGMDAAADGEAPLA